MRAWSGLSLPSVRSISQIPLTSPTLVLEQGKRACALGLASGEGKVGAGDLTPGLEGGEEAGAGGGGRADREEGGQGQTDPARPRGAKHIPHLETPHDLESVTESGERGWKGKSRSRHGTYCRGFHGSLHHASGHFQWAALAYFWDDN